MSLKPTRRIFALQVSLLSLGLVARTDDQTNCNKPGTTADGGDDTIYEVGGDVKSPKLVHYVEPAFSPKSKEAYVEGTIRISTVITKAGTATNARILSGLNAEENRTTVEALKHWKFEPGTRKGQPVNVRVTVEINFHLL